MLHDIDMRAKDNRRLGLGSATSLAELSWSSKALQEFSHVGAHFGRYAGMRCGALRGGRYHYQ